MRSRARASPRHRPPASGCSTSSASMSSRPRARYRPLAVPALVDVVAERHIGQLEGERAASSRSPSKPSLTLSVPKPVRGARLRQHLLRRADGDGVRRPHDRPSSPSIRQTGSPVWLPARSQAAALRPARRAGHSPPWARQRVAVRPPRPPAPRGRRSPAARSVSSSCRAPAFAVARVGRRPLRCPTRSPSRSSTASRSNTLRVRARCRTAARCQVERGVETAPRSSPCPFPATIVPAPLACACFASGGDGLRAVVRLA